MPLYLSCYSKGGWVGFAKENICLAQEDMKMGEPVNLLRAESKVFNDDNPVLLL